MDNSDAKSQTDLTKQALIERLARRVRDVRRQKGLPRRVLSERSGVSPRYLAQLEAGEGNISIALLERVARALDVEIETLIAKHVPAEPQAQRIARLYQRAGADVQAQVQKLLGANAPAGVKAGRICLLGLRGSGKTTLGRMAAEALDIPFVELNRLIEEETGIPLAEVLSLYGQEGYRRLETEALDRVARRTAPMVIAVSGGFVEEEAPFARLLERFHTVWLRTTPSEHVERVRNQSDLRPLRDEPDATARIKMLMQTRAPLYARAEAELDTSNQTPEATLKKLIGLIRARDFMGGGLD
ncbi:helix-turn-helix transcriptional regulator [Sulfitobacter albidus]|nr:helix-turn-helix transcriptional regulator [Sulfitobacter albidus]